MKDDVRKYIYGAIAVFLVGVLIWVGLVFVNACGLSFACNRGNTLPDTTPVPTLIPATLPPMTVESNIVAPSDKCHVAGTDLIGAWVDAGSPQTDVFEFTDATGAKCEATFEDVQPLFTKANLWYSGSLSCISCHSADLAVSPAQLDMSSYEGILAGSRRTDDTPKGTDILGGGKWESSLLYQFIAETQADVPGHDAALSSDLMVYAGTPSAPVATPTP